MKVEVDGFSFVLSSIFVRGFWLQYANFQKLIDKESVILSVHIPAHASGKPGEIETVLVLTLLSGLLSP